MLQLQIETCLAFKMGRVSAVLISKPDWKKIHTLASDLKKEEEGAQLNLNL